MNISTSNQTTLIHTEYLSSNGIRKTLVSSDDGSERAYAVKFLSELECQICFDVHEKPLQTRCCESFLCASCYISLPSPKKCPSDRQDFTGSIQDDLKDSGRLIKNQIEKHVKLFNDIQSTEINKEKSNTQNNAVQLISSPSQSTTSSTAIHSTQGIRVESASGLSNIFSSGNATITSQGSPSTSVNYVSCRSMNIGAAGITIDGRHIQGSNIIIRDGNIVSGQNLTITGQNIRNTPTREYYFKADDVHIIDLHTSSGDISIDGQIPRNQTQISVISSNEPRFRNNMLNLDCNENIQLKFPESFSGVLKLHTNMGNITTHHNYSVKSGGKLNANMGNINVKVDSLLVNAIGKTNMGNTNVNVQNRHADWQRQELLCKTNMGNINIYD